MARAIDSEAAYQFLTDQLVKESGAFSKGVNKGLNIARSAMRNPDAIPTLTPPEIVYCQDCVHHEDGYAHWCNKWEHTCPDDSEFFCKYGRKKNDSTTD